MQKIYVYIIFLFLMVRAMQTFGQEISKSRSFETIIESLAEDLEDEADYFSLLEYLEEYFENPLNINDASEEELKRLSLLNEIQIANFIVYRRTYGDIYSIYELNNIEGFNREILEKIEPFIQFQPRRDQGGGPGLPFKYGKHQLMLRSTRVVQEAKGYKSIDGEIPKYEGSPEKIYTRYRFQLKDQVSVGLTAEKDPGETFFNGSNKSGYDYYSGHINVNFNSIIRSITVGDFIVRAGQGLVLYQGFSPGKSADVLNISRNTSGSRPYTSTDENMFFRGVSTGFRFNELEMQLFYSQKNKDANLGVTTEGQYSNFFTSLQSSGYHRTASEIEDEKSIRETAGGAILAFQKNRLKLGATFFYQQFNHPFTLSDQPYNYYKFSGSNNLNTGIDYRYLMGKYQLFGEAAWSQSNGLAFLQGFIAHLHDQATFSMLFRHFDKDYQALYSGAFSEGGTTINETGLYMGLKLLPAKNFKFSAYSDFYKFPWLKYTTAGPSSGNDVLLQLDYQPSRNFLIYARYKNEEKNVKNISGEKYINSPQKKQQVRLHVQYNLSDEITLKSRVEYVTFTKETSENGIMFFQDFVYSPKIIPLKSYLRFVLFNTDSYNTRVYAYENDLLYNYAIPAYYGKGFRTYLNFSYKISPFMDLWFKLSNTSWSDRETISSGNSEISGKNLTEVKIQVRLKF